MIWRTALGLVMGCAVLGMGQETPQNGPGGGRKAGPSVTVGPIQVTAANATVQRAMVFGHAPHAVNLTTLTLSVVVDPNAVVSYLSDFKLDTVLDQNGHAVHAEFRRRPAQLMMDGNRAYLAVEMSDLPAEVTDISKIACRFNAAVAKSEPIELTDLRPNHSVTKQTSSGDTVTLGFKNTAEGFDVEMRAELKTTDPAAQRTMGRAIGAAPVRVLDGSGNVYFSAGGGTQVNGEQVSHTLRFRTGRGTRNVSFGPPARIVLLVPVSLTSTPVSVEFKDLPLP